MELRDIWTKEKALKNKTAPRLDPIQDQLMALKDLGAWKAGRHQEQLPWISGLALWLEGLWSRAKGAWNARGLGRFANSYPTIVFVSFAVQNNAPQNSN